MRRSFKFKLYHSRNNRYLANQVDIAAIIYNHCLALHKRYFKLYKKSLNKNKLQKYLTKLKKLEKNDFWKKVGSQAIQEITERIDKGYKKFFDWINKGKKGTRVSPPKFKKVKKYKSFTLKQAGWKLLGENRLIINGRKYKFSKSRDIEGVVKTVNIKRDSVGDFWVSFSCEVNTTPNRVMTGKSAGFDFGLKTFLTSSEDVDPIVSPLFHKRALSDLKEANRKLSRKKKGSNNRKKAKRNLALVHRKVAFLRDDFQWKLARKLAIDFDNLFFEDLNIRAMSRLWGRKIHDLGFSDFMKKVESKTNEFGCVVKKIGRFYPSSKTCCNCKNIKKDLELKDRIYDCFSCGISLDRDKNAAINIKMVGASTIGLEVIRPSFDGILVGRNTCIPESPGFSHG